MTISEAITRIDTLKPNAYTQSEKISWLDTVEGMIYRNEILTHENTDSITFNGYTDATADTTTLIAKAPYDELYLLWLEAKIDYYNAEYGKYNNSITRFNDVRTAFRNEYNKTHKPLGVKIKFF